MSQLTKPVGSRDHIRGNKNAPVILVEYADFECPYCGEAYPIVEKLIHEERNSFAYVFRYFPLTQEHLHALHAAYAAEAAGMQGKFWDMYQILFENQDALTDNDLIQYAQNLNLSLEQFMNDMKSQHVEHVVHDDVMSGIRSGVNGTPTFFINGIRYTGSFQYDRLHVAIQQAVAERGHATV